MRYGIAEAFQFGVDGRQFRDSFTQNVVQLLHLVFGKLSRRNITGDFRSAHDPAETVFDGRYRDQHINGHA